MSSEYFDVVIVGAGLSGIGTAWHLSEQCPDKSYVILEGREALGGTWDLFRYPGIRSDSDMFTLGYAFKPWREGKAIADGPSILEYLKETAREKDIDRHIRYRRRVKEARWSSAEASWTVTAEDTASGEVVTLRCGFLLMCSGYYSYEGGYLPEWPGQERFPGEFVHPQRWPDTLDYRDKNIVVIGSGATAVTLIPELARKARSVVMLQRSPTYMVAMPDTDWIANLLRALLPERLAYAIVRWKNIRFQQYIYRRTRTAPAKMRQKILNRARKSLGDYADFDKHFVPRYDPWDQRLCLVPNADFFEAVRHGRASIATDTIATFTETGIELDSGEHLDADIVVTATGLDLCVLGGARFFSDGHPIDFSGTFSYKSMMFSGVPNLISTFGYINASWTLKADLTAEFACRVLRHMDTTRTRVCTPTLRDADREMPADDWIKEFSSGYIQRKMHLLPRQGDRRPWLNTQNYLEDRKIIREGPIDDGVLVFSDPAKDCATDHAA